MTSMSCLQLFASALPVGWPLYHTADQCLVIWSSFMTATDLMAKSSNWFAWLDLHRPLCKPLKCNSCPPADQMYQDEIRTKVIKVWPEQRCHAPTHFFHLRLSRSRGQDRAGDPAREQSCSAIVFSFSTKIVKSYLLILNKKGEPEVATGALGANSGKSWAHEEACQCQWWWW